MTSPNDEVGKKDDAKDNTHEEDYFGAGEEGTFL
jgi:hypothetical protein